MSRRTSKPAAAAAARAQAAPSRSSAERSVAADSVPDPTMPTGRLAALPTPAADAATTTPRPAEIPSLELAGEVRRLLLAGRSGEARELYGDVVTRHQRRAWRLACYYLRDTAEADEAVQDAFVK